MQNPENPLTLLERRDFGVPNLALESAPPAAATPLERFDDILQQVLDAGVSRRGDLKAKLTSPQLFAEDPSGRPACILPVLNASPADCEQMVSEFRANCSACLPYNLVKFAGFLDALYTSAEEDADEMKAFVQALDSGLYQICDLLVKRFSSDLVRFVIRDRSIEDYGLHVMGGIDLATQFQGFFWFLSRLQKRCQNLKSLVTEEQCAALGMALDKLKASIPVRASSTAPTPVTSQQPAPSLPQQPTSAPSVSTPSSATGAPLQALPPGFPPGAAPPAMPSHLFPFSPATPAPHPMPLIPPPGGMFFVGPDGVPLPLHMMPPPPVPMAPPAAPAASAVVPMEQDSISTTTSGPSGAPVTSPVLGPVASRKAAAPTPSEPTLPAKPNVVVRLRRPAKADENFESSDSGEDEESAEEGQIPPTAGVAVPSAQTPADSGIDSFGRFLDKVLAPFEKGGSLAGGLYCRVPNKFSEDSVFKTCEKVTKAIEKHACTNYSTDRIHLFTLSSREDIEKLKQSKQQQLAGFRFLEGPTQLLSDWFEEHTCCDKKHFMRTSGGTENFARVVDEGRVARSEALAVQNFLKLYFPTLVSLLPSDHAEFLFLKLKELAAESGGVREVGEGSQWQGITWKHNCESCSALPEFAEKKSKKEKPACFCGVLFELEERLSGISAKRFRCMCSKAVHKQLDSTSGSSSSKKKSRADNSTDDSDADHKKKSKRRRSPSMDSDRDRKSKDKPKSKHKKPEDETPAVAPAPAASSSAPVPETKAPVVESPPPPPLPVGPTPDGLFEISPSGQISSNCCGVYANAHVTVPEDFMVGKCKESIQRVARWECTEWCNRRIYFFLYKKPLQTGFSRNQFTYQSSRESGNEPLRLNLPRIIFTDWFKNHVFIRSASSSSVTSSDDWKDEVIYRSEIIEIQEILSAAIPTLLSLIEEKVRNRFLLFLFDEYVRKGVERLPDSDGWVNCKWIANLPGDRSLSEASIINPAPTDSHGPLCFCHVLFDLERRLSGREVSLPAPLNRRQCAIEMLFQHHSSKKPGTPALPTSSSRERERDRPRSRSPPRYDRERERDWREDPYYRDREYERRDPRYYYSPPRDGDRYRDYPPRDDRERYDDRYRERPRYRSEGSPPRAYARPPSPYDDRYRRY